MLLRRIGTLAVSVVAAWGVATHQARAAEKRLAVTSGVDLATTGVQIDAMLEAETLVVRSETIDTTLAGRRHQRLDQRYKGIPVWGGQVVRQLSANGVVSVFGTIHEGIDVSTKPTLSAAQAEAVVEKLGGRATGDEGHATLVIYPRKDGSYVLAYKIRAAHTDKAFAIRMYFVDAMTGAIVHSYSDLKTQTAPGFAIGTGTGVLGDRKKVSAKTQSGGFVAVDVLRPNPITTHDFKGSIPLFLSTWDAAYQSRSWEPFTPFIATDNDNTWIDRAVVDAHVYSGYTYDYYFKRVGRRGLNDRNGIPLRLVVHPATREAVFDNLDNLEFYVNAFYGGVGLVVFGEGLPPDVRTRAGQSWNYVAGSLDVVGHEITHGVTEYSSDLIYEDEPGALNEAFSDMMGTSIEFFFQPEKADYLIAEDVVTPGGFRSLQNPLAYGDPDHYSIRFTGPEDNGGVHINSGIPNNVFYLAIEGGTHRLGGAVQGVGGGNREQIEKVMYRAFTQLMPANANFALARLTTIQAARDLYPSNPAVERGITQAWTAVGVN